MAGRRLREMEMEVAARVPRTRAIQMTSHAGSGSGAQAPRAAGVAVVAGGILVAPAAQQYTPEVTSEPCWVA